MKKRILCSLMALLLCTAMLLPMLTSCGEDDGNEVMLYTEENVQQNNQQPTAGDPTGEEKTEEEENAKPNDYIPPENYVDFSNSESLNSTTNIGGTGSTVVAGGNADSSKYTLTQIMEANPALGGTVAQKRNAAEAEMRKMLTLLWTPAGETVYSYNDQAYKSATAVNNDAFLQNRITLQAGKVYQGLPYTRGSSNTAVFTYGVKPENGIYTVPLNQRILSGSSKISARYGVDDVDALYWAWSVAATRIFFTNSGEMTKEAGVLPVGSYVLSKDEKKVVNSIAGLTDDVVKENGQEVMFSSYKALQKADGLVSDTDLGSHVMMAVSVTVVTKEDGSIDGNKSYVTVLEQTDANLAAFELLTAEEKEAKKDEVLVVGGIDVKYTFQELFEAGYLPVTCDDLTHDGALENVFYGDSIRSEDRFLPKAFFSTTASDEPNFVSSNRRIVYVNQVITDAEGKVVSDVTGFPTEKGVGKEVFTYYITDMASSSEETRRIGEVSTAVFKKGEDYRCVITGLLATGETVTFRDYEVTYS